MYEPDETNLAPRDFCITTMKLKQIDDVPLVHIEDSVRALIIELAKRSVVRGRKSLKTMREYANIKWVEKYHEPTLNKANYFSFLIEINKYLTNDFNYFNIFHIALSDIVHHF